MHFANPGILAKWLAIWWICPQFFFLSSLVLGVFCPRLTNRRAGGELRVSIQFRFGSGVVEVDGGRIGKVIEG
tara:strand:+ start:501 stop:719 length:219 start_codon:yes stop_codon:yes gene_type:complete